MKKMSLFLAVFIIVFSFVSCSNSDQNSNNNTNNSKLIGEWELISQTGHGSNWDLEDIKIYEDGTCFVEGEIGTWKILDGELMLLGSYGGRFEYSDSIVGKYSCDGETLEFYEANVDMKGNCVNLVYKKSK